MRAADSAGGTRRRRWGERVGLARQVLILQTAVVLLTLGAAVAAAVVVADRLVTEAARDRVTSLAATVAAIPDVTAALAAEDPTAVLQPLAERVRRDADVSFVVVMAPDGSRYSHPNPAQIGGQYLGTIAPALAGETVVETFEGTLGPSVRAVVPVAAPAAEPDDPPIGLVSVGVTVDRVSEALYRPMALLTLAGLAAVALAAAGAWWIAQRLRRQTFGLAPAELAREHAHHQAVLHAVREGLLVIDADRRLVLANQEARRLLDIDPDDQDRPVEELAIDGTLGRLLSSGDRAEDELHLAGERLVVVNQLPVRGRGPEDRALGTVLTLRDHTEVAGLADQLGAVESLAESLRAQAHEAANRLHTVVTLVELGDVDAAVQLATAEAHSTQDLANRLVGRLDEPAIVALLLGKASEAHERGVELVVAEGSTAGRTGIDSADLVTVLGNLVDNAIDATAPTGGERRVEVTVRQEGDVLVVEVSDTGPGLSPEQLTRAFEPGWSTKPQEPGRRHGRGVGLALVRQVVRRLQGDVTLRNRGDPPMGAVVTVRLPVPRAVDDAPVVGTVGT